MSVTTLIDRKQLVKIVAGVALEAALLVGCQRRLSLKALLSMKIQTLEVVTKHSVLVDIYSPLSRILLLQ